VSATRMCVVCRKTLEQDEGLRIVLAPDGTAAIDFRQKLPGRGAWVHWTRSCMEQLSERGRLNRAFKRDVRIPDAVEGDEPFPLGPARRWIERRQKELLGLGQRAGQVKTGANVVLGVVRKGQAEYIVLARDAGDTVARDWERKARGYELPLYRALLGAGELGDALGRTGVRSVLAAGNGPLSRALQTELKRGSAFL
jgi:uncharacterized protein